MVCLRKILVAKKFMDKNKAEVSRFSLEILSHNAERVRREPFSVSLISGIEKNWMRRCGGVKVFNRKILV